jgi:hypothetical protein
LKDVFFKPRLGAIENAYRGLSWDLVMFREASLPDACIICGTPSFGNTHRAKFEPYARWRTELLFSVVYWTVGTRYFVDFPFCSICQPADFDIRATRIDKNVGFFSGVSNTVLKKLPPIPLDLAARLEGTRAQRAFRWLMN